MHRFNISQSRKKFKLDGGVLTIHLPVGLRRDIDRLVKYGSHNQTWTGKPGFAREALEFFTEALVSDRLDYTPDRKTPCHGGAIRVRISSEMRHLIDCLVYYGYGDRTWSGISSLFLDALDWYYHQLLSGRFRETANPLEYDQINRRISKPSPSRIIVAWGRQDQSHASGLSEQLRRYGGLLNQSVRSLNILALAGEGGQKPEDRDASVERALEDIQSINRKVEDLSVHITAYFTSLERRLASLPKSPGAGEGSR